MSSLLNNAIKSLNLLVICAVASFLMISTSIGGGDSGHGVINYKIKQTKPIVPGGSLKRISAKYFDGSYKKEFDRQHLGIDLPAPKGSTVKSPVYGRVVAVNMATDPFQSYVIIEDFNSGWQHVIGHIDSSIRKNDIVVRGTNIGKVVTAGTGPHVHWGVNRDVRKAMSGSWGWGRAPSDASKNDAAERGWIDPLKLVK